jgi:hypothetical protein
MMRWPRVGAATAGKSSGQRKESANVKQAQDKARFDIAEDVRTEDLSALSGYTPAAAPIHKR